MRAIARLNQRITVQRLTAVVDEYHNHKDTWEDYFSCAAYASTYKAEEQEGARITEQHTVTFEIRRCSETSVITATGYRILFQSRPYNIEAVDPMNYTGGIIRLRCARIEP